MQRLGAWEKSEILKLEESLTSFGFFYISGCGINESHVLALRRYAAELFALPVSVKADMHIRKSPHFRGWSGIDEEVTLGIPDHKVDLLF
jgi:isopenicillin N synthase-like dioxygenase